LCGGDSRSPVVDRDGHGAVGGLERDMYVFFFQAEDGIRDRNVTGVQTCALPISCSYGTVPGADAQAIPPWRIVGHRDIRGGDDSYLPVCRQHEARQPGADDREREPRGAIQRGADSGVSSTARVTTCVDLGADRYETAGDGA